jgi:hypothetical protein
MKKLPVIVCSILAAEIREIARHTPLGEVYVVDSVYHFSPEKLYNRVLEIIQEKRLKEAILVYGECSAGFKMPFPGTTIYRLKKHSCIDLLMSSEEEYYFRQHNIMVLLPEWATRWQELFYSWFGFKPHSLKAFMQEMHSEIICIDDVTIEITDSLVRSIEQASGITCRKKKITLDHLSLSINQLIEGVQGG